MFGQYVSVFRSNYFLLHFIFMVSFSSKLLFIISELVLGYQNCKLLNLWSDSCLNMHLLISKAGPFDQVAFLSTFQLRFADRFLDIQLSEEFTLCVLSHDQRVHQYVICTLIHGCLGIAWPSLFQNFSIILCLARVRGYQLTPHLTVLRTKYLFVCVRYKHTSK